MLFITALPTLPGTFPGTFPSTLPALSSTFPGK